MGSVLNKPKVNLFGMSKRKSLMFTDMGRTQQMKKHLRQQSTGPVQQGWLLTVPQKAHMKALYFFSQALLPFVRAQMGPLQHILIHIPALCLAVPTSLQIKTSKWKGKKTLMNIAQCYI